MHEVHHTEAFILKLSPSGEANARVWLFTKSFGLVIASVQGVRKSGSKLSMQLSEYSLVSADLVRGKDVWRLVSVTQLENPFLENDTKVPLELGRSYVRTLAAVERFCQGEEQHEALFEHLNTCLAMVYEKELDPKTFDALSLWKVLLLLGYGDVSHEALFTMPFAEVIRSMTHVQRGELVKEVNAIIKETHL